MKEQKPQLSINKVIHLLFHGVATDAEADKVSHVEVDDFRCRVEVR